MGLEIDDEEMAEAWYKACRKFHGKRLSQVDIWISRKLRGLTSCPLIGDKIIDLCNVWLEEMDDRYGEDDRT